MAELESLLKRAEKETDQAELYFEKTDSILLKSVLDRIESSDSTFHNGYSLRVIKNGRMGFSYFTSPDEFGRALKDAVHSSKFSPKIDPSFSPKKTFNEVSGVYSKKLINKSEDELSDSLLQMVDVIKRTKATPIQSFVSRSESISKMINSEGGRFEKKETGFEVSSIAQFRESTSSDFKVSREFFETDKIAENAADYAVKFSGGRPVSGEFDIIIHPSTVVSLLSKILLPSVDGEEIFRKNSYLHGRLGQEICPDYLTFWDDPLLPKGIESSKCDDEGAVSCKKPIVRKGKLSTYLCDMETSFQAKMKNTGNGFRGSFVMPPTIEQTNFVVESGQKTKLEEVKGVLVYDVLAVHNANTLNGDFALEVYSGAMFDGEIKKAIRSCSIVGNFFELLKNVRMADDFQNYGFYYGPSWIYRGKIV